MAPRSTSIRLAAVGLAAGALLLAGCSSSATTAPGGSSAPAPSTALGGSSAPAPSTAAGSSSGPVLPGFSLPNDDKDLEALLPSTLCGKTDVKTSLSGADLSTGADPAFAATLAQLGKSTSDVGFAIAEPDPTTSSDCAVTIGVFAVNGADGNQLKTVFLAAATAEETAYTESNVGGKDVFIDASDPTAKNYAYFKGDGVFFVQAPDDATAAPLLTALP
ncbi:MAG TPA: hypothetical protein VID26_05155 [Candidatus Limnocylindrales bacterium]|jgi:hypothetical protein